MSANQPASGKSASGTFDPYHKWLGIRGGQSPPNHYRLLGLELWETDEEVIRDAFSRQSNHLKQFRNSSQRELCEQVLEELRSARDTLLEQRLRAAYDRWLKLAAGQNAAEAGAGNSAGQPYSVHTDKPPQSVQRAVACGRCGTENAGARKFCGGCGASLWEPCIECGVLCGPADLHCGACGTNIANAVQKRVQDFQTALDHATNLVQQGKTNLAVETVEQAMLSDHPRLAELAARAEQLIAEAQSARVRFDELLENSLSKAEALCAEGDFEQATAVLKNLPNHLQGEMVVQLLSAIYDRRNESARLLAEIQKAVAAKQFEGLLNRVNRLLELAPDPQVQKLQQRLREREAKRAEAQKNQLSELAMAEVQRHNYAKAVEILHEIPDDQRSPEIEKLIEKVTLRSNEVECLNHDLRNAAVYDEHLLPIAERLLKLQPNAKAAQKFVKVLRARQTSQSVAANISWPRLPPKGQWGCPIELVSSFKRVDVEQQDSPVLKSPETFCVAIGLALQGLNKGAIDINLAPSEKRGLFGLWGGKKRNYKTAWGIDVGQSTLKAVQLAFVPATDQVTVVNSKHIPLASNAEFNGGPAELMQLAVKTFLDQCDLTGSAVCISFPTRKMVNRMFDLPPVETKKIPEIMQYEVKQHIPLPLETVSWDYQVLEPIAEANDGNSVEIKPVALCGAKLEDVQAHLATFTERGINVDVLQSDAAALHNFAAWEQQLPNATGKGKEVVVLLEIGASSSNVVVTDGHTFSMRGISLGGNDFARALAREFRLTREQSEKLKRAPTAAPYLHQVYGALEPIFQNLAAEVWQPIDQYLLQDTRRTKHRLLLAGGETKLHGLLKYLCHGTS